MKAINKFILLSLVLTIVAACSTSPTGRKQLILMSSSSLDKMGLQSFEEIKKQEKISTNKEVINFVQCVADNITPNVSSKVHSGSWEVVVFNSDQVNAFALPGGKIGVYTGLLKVSENQNQLAAVMGHEVGHVIAQHSNERLSSSSLMQTGMQVADSAMAAGGVENKNLYMAGLGLGAQYGVLMPYGRVHESEADIIGQELMAKSGFNPKASVDLWRNMAKQSKGAPPEFLSTHPSNETRIKGLSKHLAKSQPMYKQSKQTPNCAKPEIKYKPEIK
jgi:predicted Zn-dependent protease